MAVEKKATGISGTRRIPFVLLTLALIGGAMVVSHYSSVKPPIRIGVLHSLTGSTAESEKPLVDALRLAIEEANAAGGIKGQKIEAIVVNCRSDPDHCAHEAERLITLEQVQALFGCWTSACRKAVKPVVEKYHHLLFYAVQYEGMEQSNEDLRQSPNILYGGAVPNQLVMPAVHWAMQSLVKPAAAHSPRLVYLAGSDHVFSRVVHILIKDLLAAHGAEVVGERYVPVGAPVMDELAEDIADKRPDFVLNTISGPDNNVFFGALAKKGVMPDEIPVLSFTVTEVNLNAQDVRMMKGHYAARNYFQSIPSPKNQAFVARFKDRFGEQSVIDGPTETSYVNMQIWINAALEAGSGDLAQVQRTILRQSLPAPEGFVAVDPVTHHVWKATRVGKIRGDGQFGIVWDSGRPIEPEPFPAYRSREEWDALLEIAIGAKP